jgi:YihY family inner membrane protein
VNPVERTLRSVDAFQQRHPPAAFVFAVFKKFGDDNGGTLVGSLTHSGFASVFPLLLLLVTILSLVAGGHPGVQNAVLRSTLSEFPVIGGRLAANIHAVRRASAFGLTVSLAGLVWGATGLAQAGVFTMEQVWNLPGSSRPSYWLRLLRSAGFLAALGLGAAVTTALAWLATYGRGTVLIASGWELLAVVANTALYLLAFRVLTPQPVGSRSLVPGAVVGGVGWTVLQAAGSYVIGHYLRNDSAVYGTFGAILVLLVWVYFGVELSVYAAEVNVVLARRLWPRSVVQPPLTDADQRVLAAQATENRRRPEQRVQVSFDVPPMGQQEYLERRSGASPGG